MKDTASEFFAAIRRAVQPFTALGARLPKPIQLPQIKLPGDLPPTNFRCARCGEVVARAPGKDGRTFSARDRSEFACRTHGPLQDFDFEQWQAEWIRKGKPKVLNYRLPPAA